MRNQLYVFNKCDSVDVDHFQICLSSFGGIPVAIFGGRFGASWTHINGYFLVSALWASNSEKRNFIRYLEPYEINILE